MADIEDRLSKVEKSAESRLQILRNHLPEHQVYYLCATAFFSGLIMWLPVQPHDFNELALEAQGEEVMPTASNTEQTINLEDYTIKVVESSSPTMQGRTGYTYGNTNMIYIQGGRSIEEMYDTCVHEKIHTMGVDGGKTDDHTWVYKNSDDIVDETCLNFIYLLKENTAY